MTAATEKILMIAFCWIEIMPSVASRRKVIFCARKLACSARKRVSRASDFSRAAALLVASLLRVGGGEERDEPLERHQARQHVRDEVALPAHLAAARRR